ncbi:MAG: type II toxin-antitoxin system VapC family toxin [Proteobacteria bacterium]|nr:type II toxin-antitoxin system VapC family toxin [Pseudomonadota bacterium]
MPAPGLVVLDASVVLAALLPEQHSDRARDILIQVAAEGARVPSLWPLEIGNVLLIAQRRGLIRAEERARFLDQLARLPIAVDPETAARAWPDIAPLAERHRLTLYDAAYLELSLRAALPLASFDAALRRAAADAGAALL